MSPRAGQVPDWLLERLAAGELSERQASRLRDELGPQVTTARLAELAASNAEILTTLAPATVVTEVRRRAEQRPAARRARPLFTLSLAATCAAGLAVFLSVRDPGVTNVTTPSGEDVEVTREKGLKPSLRIHRKTKAGAEPVPPLARVSKGDTLQLGYVAAGQRFGVIASIDARGTVTLHLPESPGPAAALEKDGERALPHSFELDDSPGFERFVFVTSNTPFATTDVAHALKNGRQFPTALAAVELTLKKETP